MTVPSTVPSTKPQPVLLFGAVTTFLTAVFGGLTLVSGLQANTTLATVCGVGTLVTAALNQAKDVYVKGQVVPVNDTAAYVNEDRELIAGPASSERTGAPVEVVPAETVTYDGYGAPVIEHEAP